MVRVSRWSGSIAKETDMRDETKNDTLVELGAASVLTLGEPELEAREDVTIEDFKD